MIFIAIFLLFTSGVNASEYFSSFVKNNPRMTIIAYKDEVVAQHLLNKRYVYTIPKDGFYSLQNDINIYVKNGKVIQKKVLKENQIFDLGMKRGAFFNQENESCNLLKFKVAQNMLARDCSISFHQYQIIPIYPDFIRVIVASKSEIFQPKSSCTSVAEDTNNLIIIEEKTADAIKQERELEEQKSNQQLTRDEEGNLKKSKKTQLKLKPWEFGINERNIIMGENVNSIPLKNEALNIFYINYFNDIGCVPFSKLKLASVSEFIKYQKLFMEGFSIVSEYSIEQDKTAFILFDIAEDEVLVYRSELVEKWQAYIEKYKLEQVNLKNQ